MFLKKTYILGGGGGESEILRYENIYIVTNIGETDVVIILSLF
jgi:hypothetical protein